MKKITVLILFCVIFFSACCFAEENEEKVDIDVLAPQPKTYEEIQQAKGRFEIITASPGRLADPVVLLLDSVTGNTWKMHISDTGGVYWIRVYALPTSYKTS